MGIPRCSSNIVYGRKANGRQGDQVRKKGNSRFKLSKRFIKGKIGEKEGKHRQGNGRTRFNNSGGTSGEELHVQDVHGIPCTQRSKTKQARAGRHYSQRERQNFEQQFRQFDRGSKKFRKRLKSTINDLIDATLRENKQTVTRKRTAHGYRRAALALVEREREAERAVTAELRSDAETDRYGYVPLEKPENAFRCLFENWNSLGVFSGQKRVAKVEHLRKRYHVDTILGCETQCDWRHADHDHQFENLFGLQEGTVVSVGYNRTRKKEEIIHNQRGGTAMATIGRMTVQVDWK